MLMKLPQQSVTSGIPPIRIQSNLSIAYYYSVLSMSLWEAGTLTLRLSCSQWHWVGRTCSVGGCNSGNRDLIFCSASVSASRRMA